MKKISLLLAILFGFAPTVYAASPSSVAAQNDINPSTVNTNGGFDFQARDNGGHLGWCKGQGHLVPPGNQASGHRNHWDCDNDDGGGDDGEDDCPDGSCLPH
ncbi:MAG: hypothetical protein HZB40_18010 [Rhodocyclales bacterium]|nr:hypothetical protein [Rhodocyclales bacterium]